MIAIGYPDRATLSSWHGDFTAQSAIFGPLRELVTELSAGNRVSWPRLDDYQRLLEQTTGGLRSRNNAVIHFVDQQRRMPGFENGYEPRIYLHGEVQTRRQNWHDLFQLFIWCQFPQTKIQLNALHYHAALERLSARRARLNRSPLENAITLFDECGVIIASSNSLLLQLIRDMQWWELFWLNRDGLAGQLHCIVFGHALYEKAMKPYPGLTANALLVETDPAFHQLGTRQQWHWLDSHVCNTFASAADSLTPRYLYPFPILGMPGWDRDNRYPDYYANRDYFRSSRRGSR